MPHVPAPPTVYEYGRQWSALADTSTSRTSTQYSSGRGFAGCGPGCVLHHHGPQRPDDTEIVIARVLARLKLGGIAEAPRMLR